MNTIKQNTLLFIAFLFIAFLLINTGCRLEKSENIDAKQVNQTIKDRKLKRIKEPQIIEKAYKTGILVKDIVLQRLNTQTPCQLPPIALPDSLNTRVVKIQILCADTDSMQIKEREIWQAYQYSMANNIEITEVGIQRIGEELFLYPYPITTHTKQIALLSILISKKEVIRSL